MPIARKSRRLMLLALAAGTVSFAIWPKAPQLERYTTTVTNGAGKKVQVRLLVPAGWTEDNSRRPTDPFVSAYTIRPPVKRSSWLPGWLNDRLFGQPERISSVVINPVSILRDEKIHVDEGMTQMGSSTVRFWTAGREIKEAGPLTLGYVRTNHAEFEATYRQICESLRVVR